MKTRILRACTAIAASCCVILGARSQTVTAPVTAQPVTPPTPLQASPAAATAPPRYSFSMQGANWRLPSSGAFPALSGTGVQPVNDVIGGGVPAPSAHPKDAPPPKHVPVSIVRRPDAASTDLKALMNNGWRFTLTITVYDSRGKSVETLVYGNAVVKSVTDIFDAQRQLEEQLEFEYTEVKSMYTQP
jgi:hypothetical protein